MKKINIDKKTIIACLILCLVAICYIVSIRLELSYTKENLGYARDYIDLIESDNPDYILDVASETDTYSCYYEYVADAE